jgi:hypothetical protein
LEPFFQKMLSFPARPLMVTLATGAAPNGPSTSVTPASLPKVRHREEKPVGLGRAGSGHGEGGTYRSPGMIRPSQRNRPRSFIQRA